MSNTLKNLVFFLHSMLAPFEILPWLSIYCMWLRTCRVLLLLFMIFMWLRLFQNLLPFYIAYGSHFAKFCFRSFCIACGPHHADPFEMFQWDTKTFRLIFMGCEQILRDLKITLYPVPGKKITRSGIRNNKYLRGNSQRKSARIGNFQTTFPRLSSDV